MTVEQGLPASAAGSTGHDTLVDEAFQEGELGARLGELPEKDVYTAAELRGALGDTAEGLTDEELVAEWQKAVAAKSGEAESVEEGEEEEVPAQEPVKLEGFKLYNEKGEEIADPAKVSIVDLLTGKVQVGYTALKGEQRKNLRDLARVASLGHYNEKIVVDLRTERAQAMQRAAAAEAKAAEHLSIQRQWDAALTALVNGNAEPIQRLAAIYQQKLAQGGTTAAEQPTGQQDAEYDAIGQQVFNEHVVPRAQELATQYGANAIEVAQYILYLCEQEGEFLTPAKVEAILQYEMPAILEQTYGSASSVVTPKEDPRDAKIAALEKQMAELTATTKNAATERLRNKNKKAPPVGSGSTPSGGETIPEGALKSRQAYKDWTRGE